MPEKNFTPAELYDAWPVLSLAERVEGFEFLQRDDADNFFLQLGTRARAELLMALPIGERRLWMRMLAPDDAAGRIKGVVNLNDIVDVVQEEATEDIQKLGGVQAFEEPYLQVPLSRMIRKRAGWLAALFLGEMLTATAMGQFEAEITRAVVLALFVPLIISSGGNSGSQATTLVIRAMALGEVRLGDWWRVIRREVFTGLGLGLILATIGLLRILVWQGLFDAYGEHYFLVALTVAFSLVGVVLWGAVAGSILPFILRALNFDPASASAPFVATLVDVTGLVIYFSIAAVLLHGTLL
jgi:magnesium transporter